MSLPKLPPYAPELFVDRAAEVALVQGVARQIGEGATDLARTIIFRGERGLGKTWLSLHLNRVVLPSIPGFTSLLISLAPRPTDLSIQSNEWFSESDLQDPQMVAKEIIFWVADSVGATTAANASLRELTSWLARDAERIFSQRMLALIVDSVFEADWELLKILEPHLLAPLAGFQNVLIVMTGRGRQYPWVSPYLRVETEEVALRPFDHDTTVEQLEHQQVPNAEKRAEQVIQLGGGYPMTNVLLARAPDPEHPEKALDEVAERLLAVVLRPETRRRVRECFEALCVLEGFREDVIPLMLAARHNDRSYEQWTIEHIRVVRDEMISTHLVRWEEGKFIIDASIRRVLESLLRFQETGAWRRLHCCAYHMYNQWTQKYPRWEEHYRNNAAGHAGKLTEAGYALEECDEVWALDQPAAHVQST